MSLSIKGVQGWVYHRGRKVYKLNNWTMNVASGITDVTEFHSSGVAREYTDVVDITGSISGVYEIQDTSTGGLYSEQIQITRQFEGGSTTLNSGLLKLIESDASMWHGTVLFTDFNKNAPAASHQTINLNWAAHGRWRHTTDTDTST